MSVGAPVGLGIAVDCRRRSVARLVPTGGCLEPHRLAVRFGPLRAAICEHGDVAIKALVALGLWKDRVQLLVPGDDRLAPCYELARLLGRDAGSAEVPARLNQEADLDSQPIRLLEHVGEESP